MRAKALLIPRRALLILGTLSLILLFTGRAWGQEERRSSLETFQRGSDVVDAFEGLAGSIGEGLFGNAVDWKYVRLFPSLTERLRYDDNVLLASSDETADTMLETAPGLVLQVDEQAHRGELGYTATHRKFFSESQLDTWDHDAHLDVRLDFVDTYFRIADRFERSQEVRGVDFSGKIERRENRFRLEGGHQFADVGLGLRYEHRQTAYGPELSREQDYVEQTAAALATFPIEVDLTGSGEYAVSFRSHRGDYFSDLTTHRLNLGADYRPAPWISWLAKAGATLVRSDGSGTVSDRGNTAGAYLEAGVNAELDLDLRGGVTITHRPEVSSTSNFNRTTRATARLTWQMETDLRSHTSFYVEHAAPDSGDSRSLLGFAVGLDARVLDNLTAGFGYEFVRRSGGGPSYTDNQVWLSAILHF